MMQRIAGAVGVTLLILAATYVVLDEPKPAQPGAPKVRSEHVQALLANVPQIAKFDQFNVNDLNPFVPSSERMAEKARIAERKLPPKPQPPHKQPLPVPSGPPVVHDIKPPPWAPPEASFKDQHSPLCIGLIRNQDGDSVLTIKMGAAGDEQQMRIGDTIDGWQLNDLSGTTATFHGPDGNDHVLDIESETVIAAMAAPAAKAPKVQMPAVLPGPAQPPQPGGKGKGKGKGNGNANGNGNGGGLGGLTPEQRQALRQQQMQLWQQQLQALPPEQRQQIEQQMQQLRQRYQQQQQQQPQPQH